MPELKVGDLMPEVSFRAPDRVTISIADFKGDKNVVIAFYVEDGTPGLHGRPTALLLAEGIARQGPDYAV